MQQLVTQLQLTDLCLFTEAGYTRHLSQADLPSAFQDHPLGLEHFPTGSLVLSIIGCLPRPTRAVASASANATALDCPSVS